MKEVPIYNNIIRLCSIFKKLKLRKQHKDILVNLHKYYEKFVDKKILNKKWFPLLKKKMNDVNKIYLNLNNFQLQYKCLQNYLYFLSNLQIV
jgi:hypothetical protein